MESVIRHNTASVSSLPEQFDLAIRRKPLMSQTVFEQISTDKSISQRAIVWSALTEGTSRICGVLQSDDIFHCIEALKQLGVHIEWDQADVIVKGVGLTGLKQPRSDLYIGNSATATRLIMSLIAGSSLDVVIRGNALLSRRPMDWVVEPLRQMGAAITYLGEEGFLPVRVQGAFPLKPIHWNATVASAQQKSAVLTAALFANGVTAFRQQCQSRNHTELMLQDMGAHVKMVSEQVTELQGCMPLKAQDRHVPGDISSAAFLMAAYLLRGEEMPPLVLKKVGVNPTRTGFVQVLQAMGADISYSEETLWGSEPVADLHIQPARHLQPVRIEGMAFVQSLIDEIPLLAAISTVIHGDTTIIDCMELKDKDTNRIDTTADVLRRFGAELRTCSKGMIIIGGKSLQACHTHSHGDHRIAMTAAILASSLPEASVIEDAACLKVSYPTFLEDLAHFADIRIIPK
ncbi:3-phosphoshikimate 1-carboxyvinyltransferase [Marinicrinis sediminis]|uniref:3-phosphoshikimate 1-carboxyvinyltransferase n=1 Tax=Marinicrinis sediminis TaxID=1652465 RepID=A0ABW5R7G4_9BACL